MSPELITTILGIVMGGGGLAALYKAKQEAPLTTAQAQSIVIGDLTKEIERLRKLMEARDQNHRRREKELLDRIDDLEERLKRAGI